MYISSDLHFFHNKVLEFQSHTRPFKDLDEMNQAYVDHWNSLAVKRGIKMFHLGDFSFGGPSQTEEIASQLKGDIIFIKGNHDRSHTIKVLEKYGEVKDYHEEKYKKHLFCMMHYPIYEWNKQHHGSFMLHGHCHGKMVDSEESRGRTMDVGIDVHGRFLHFDEVVDKLTEREIVTAWGRGR